jgi:hypothetical protein
VDVSSLNSVKTFKKSISHFNSFLFSPRYFSKLYMLCLV